MFIYYQNVTVVTSHKFQIFQSSPWLDQVLRNARKAQQAGDYRRATRLLRKLLPTIKRLHKKGIMV